jgi:hypothetical protein
MSLPRNATIEERERYAYITGNPVAPLLSLLVDFTPQNFKVLEEAHDELCESHDELKRRMKEIDLLCAVTR